MIDLGISSYHTESTLYLSRTHPDSEAKLWISKYTEIGLSVIITFTDLRFRSPLHPGDNTKVWVVKSRSSNRYAE